MQFRLHDYRRILAQSMQPLIQRIAKEEADKAAENIRRRVLEESLRLTVDMQALAHAEGGHADIIINIKEEESVTEVQS